MNERRDKPNPRHTALVLLIMLASSGWVVPIYLSVASVIYWCESVVGPLLYEGEGILDSFPYLSFAGQCAFVGFLWLAAVCVVWSVWLSNHFLSRSVHHEVGAGNPPRSDRE